MQHTCFVIDETTGVRFASKSNAHGEAEILLEDAVDEESRGPSHLASDSPIVTSTWWEGPSIQRSSSCMTYGGNSER